jgi:hypothetical protein
MRRDIRSANNIRSGHVYTLSGVVLFWPLFLNSGSSINKNVHGLSWSLNFKPINLMTLGWDRYRTMDRPNKKGEALLKIRNALLIRQDIAF